MSQLCFATFARALQKVLIQPAASYTTPTRQGPKKPSTARPKMTSTGAYVVEVLLSWIQDFAPVADRDGFDVWRTPKTVSGLLKQDVELHTGFGPVLKQPGLREAAREAFGKIAHDIAPMREIDFKAELIELIKDDPEVSAEAAEELLYTADQDDVSFYAETFLSAISRTNKKRANNGVTEADVVLAVRNGDLCPVCRKERLVKTVKGERRPFFEIVTFTIDNDSAKTDREAVCVKCAKQVSTNDTLIELPDVVNKLRDIRNRRIAATALQDTALDSQLHPAITSVIETLGERIVTGAIPELTLARCESLKRSGPSIMSWPSGSRSMSCSGIASSSKSSALSKASEVAADSTRSPGKSPTFTTRRPSTLMTSRRYSIKLLIGSTPTPTR